MLGKLFAIARHITPPFLMPLALRMAIRVCQVSIQIQGRRIMPKIYKYFSDKKGTPEQLLVLDNLKRYGFNVFPYPHLFEIKPQSIEVYHDDYVGLPYVLLDNKRLYYPAKYDKKTIQISYHAEQIVSQHVDSPHCYLTDGFMVEDGDVVVDCGAADGNFSLSVVEKAGKIYLFEPSRDWHEPLRATFAPWKEKVVLVSKYVSDSSEGENIRLDDYFEKQPPPAFIKMDIEGFEGRALQGASRILRMSGGVKKLSVCTYHRQDDEANLSAFLRDCGYQTTPSKGYMLYIFDDDVKPPYLRRGIIRAIKLLSH